MVAFRATRASALLSIAGMIVLALLASRYGRPVLWGAGESLQLDPQSPRSAPFALNCSAEGSPISPLIYGIGGSDDPWSTGTTARRWGGNTTSRYNWELDTWNAANDWFYSNVGGKNPRTAIDQFLTENLKRGVSSALTVPMLGWVAKDATSYSFPVSVFGAQQRTSPENPDAGNGMGRDGKPLPPGPPTRTSIAWTPEHAERLVLDIRARDKARGRSVGSYILDNEPMLWHATHRDVHPEPAGYDELLAKTIAFGSAIRRADPEARIAGPAEWGWLAYHHSARDIVAGVFLRPDRRAHGDEPLIPWYLRKLREHEQKTGTRVLDILDVHFYPQGERIYGDAADPDTAARRIRATRSLWDPTYRDESWINERMRVIPLLREWIAKYYPGLGISIGEWDFGGNQHMSGGLATAEALGRFGVEGITSAYRWGTVPEKSPSFWAFRAYRNFDGQGGRFLDHSVPVEGKVPLASLFASRNAARSQVVAVLLNTAPLSPALAQLSLKGCGAAAMARGFTFTGGEKGFTNVTVKTTGDAATVLAAPYSITVIDVTLAPSAQ